MVTITAVGPTLSSFHSSSLQQSASGRILSLAVVSVGARMYAGSYAGVWRSDDAGKNWRQLTRPQPGFGLDVDVPGAIYAPHVFDLAVSPVNPNLVLATGARGKFATSRNGIYRSIDGGTSWSLVQTASFVNEIIFAPDDPTLVYAALGFAIAISHDAGQTWTLRSPGGDGTALHVAVAPQEPNGIRRVYAAGAVSGVAAGVQAGQIWYSTDGGNMWSFDQGIGIVNSARQTLSDLQQNWQIEAGIEEKDRYKMPSFAGNTADAVGGGAHILAVEPENPARVYLAALGGANGPSYYNEAKNVTPIAPDGTLCNTAFETMAGEGSLWLGDFSQFVNTGRAQWQQLPGPPAYAGVSTRSGNTFVLAKPTSTGFLLFFSDSTHVHVSIGRPAAASWHRFDGKDVSAVKQAGEHSNQLFVHVDPHALAFTADFEISLKTPPGVSFPYNQNRILNQHLSGRIWMANDGGVYRSDDGGESWQPSAGLETLDPVNLAGLVRAGKPPALYMGTGDNDDFFTLDGGNSWKDALSSCGDCDAWFADVAQPSRVLEFLPRNDGMRLIKKGFPFPGYPDPGDASQNHFIRRPRESNISSGFVLRGFNPVIQTLQGEAPLSDGDYVFIAQKVDGTRILLRTRSISSLKSQGHWDITTLAEQVGPPLPEGVDIVQVGGGHANPVFYVADVGRRDSTGRVFKLDESLGVWKVIVPGGPPGGAAIFARRFFVDPYDPELIYLLDSSEIKVSTDGGKRWLLDPFLQQTLTAGGKLLITSNSVLTDMLFVRDEPFTRFAFGHAGVFCTTNGVEWLTVLNSIALPGFPESGFFDPVSDPVDRALYVNIEGRSILRLGGLHHPPPLKPPPTYGLLEFAAILEA